MINEITIRNIADYILLNACSVDSSGFYNGKAGIVVTLYETSRYLQCEYLEEQAFALLQETLLAKTDDISFENGLSGIGYVLLYLIKEKFIIGNFEELFDKNHLKIAKGLETVVKQGNPYFASSFLTSIYYLRRYNEEATGQNNKQSISHLLKLSSEQLINNMKKMRQGVYTFPKIDIVRLLEIYLKVIDKCSLLEPEIEILELYCDLFIKNKFICNRTIGYYLSKIGKKTNNENIYFVGEKNIKLAVQDIYPETLSLSQKIYQLYWMRQSYESYDQIINSIEQDFFHQVDNDALEKNLLKGISPQELIAGYKSGLSRFLLYYIYTIKDTRSNYELLDL